jgi:hypothetical protein
MRFCDVPDEATHHEVARIFRKRLRHGLSWEKYICRLGGTETAPKFWRKHSTQHPPGDGRSIRHEEVDDSALKVVLTAGRSEEQHTVKEIAA